MARKPKKGVEYFPHFVNSGKTIFMLESRFGNDGYAFWFKLLEILGQQEGLCYDCNNQSNWIFLTSKCRVNDISATEILGMLASVDAIDMELWGKKIIWVQNFCDHVADVFKKRGTEIPVRPHFCDRNDTTPVDIGNKSTQSKVKESKVKESIPPTEKKLPDESLAIANDLFTFHRDRIDPGYKVKPTAIENWAKDIDKLNRLDGRSWDDIRKLVDYVKQPGQFWATNVMSGDALRDKFQRIWPKIPQSFKSSPQKVDNKKLIVYDNCGNCGQSPNVQLIGAGITWCNCGKWDFVKGGPADE
jgi:hypothetical protein